METPKDDSYGDKISRITAPVPLTLGDETVTENDSFALFGSSSSSIDEKSAEELVPETPSKPKNKLCLSDRNSSPLKEIHQNILNQNSPVRKGQTPIASPHKVALTLEDSPRVANTTAPDPIPICVFASPPQDPPQSQNLFKTLDESSFYFHVQNTPLKSDEKTEAIAKNPSVSQTTEIEENVQDKSRSFAKNDSSPLKPEKKKKLRIPLVDLFASLDASDPKKARESIHEMKDPHLNLPLPVASQERETIVEDLSEKLTGAESKTSKKRKSESNSPTVLPKLQKLDKSRLTINSQKFGTMSNRPRRTIRKRQTDELDETPTIRLSQSPQKPEVDSQKPIVRTSPKVVKAKPSRTTIRRRRKTSIGETQGNLNN